MFIATIINFLLSSLNLGAQVATLIVFIRKPLIQDIHYPLSVKRFEDLVYNTLRNVNLIGFWAGAIPVSTIKLSRSDPVLYLSCGDISQRSHCHLEGLGPLSRPTVGGPRTLHSVDWNRG